MLDVLDVLFEWPLLLYTGSLLVALSFWSLSFLGVFDFEVADVDLDVDADMDADADADLGAGGGVLGLLGLGLIPFSLFATLLLFCFGWCGLVLHALLGPALDGALGTTGTVIVLAPSALLVAAVASSGASRLLHPLFRDYGRAQAASELVGRIAVLNSGSVTTTFGSAIVRLPEGGRIEIATRADTDENDLQYGDRVLVYDYDAEHNLYFVAPASELDDDLLPTL